VITHPTDPALTLIELSDLDANPLPPPARGHEAALRTVVEWTRSYLTRGHPELGRRGSVCPYVDTALNLGSLYLTVHRGRPGSPQQAAAALEPYRDWFLQLAPSTSRAGLFTAILVLFPYLDGNDLTRIIDGAQRLQKPAYVARGLMIGEFHPGPPDKPGLHNPDFRPLASPVPMLAIRHMVATDRPFLQDDPELAAVHHLRFGTRRPVSSGAAS
jgi:hypothetical protein